MLLHNIVTIHKFNNLKSLMQYRTYYYDLSSEIGPLGVLVFVKHTIQYVHTIVDLYTSKSDFLTGIIAIIEL